MNRLLQYFNLCGVVALAILCIVQWRSNRQVNLEAFGLTKIRLEQQEKISAQEKSLKGCTQDLDSFREQLTRASSTLKEIENKLATAERDNRQLSAERDQLKTNVANWTAAAAARDEQLKIANTELQKLGQERNDAVTKFNELAGKYNKVVSDLNEARAK